MTGGTCALRRHRGLNQLRSARSLLSPPSLALFISLSLSRSLCARTRFMRATGYKRSLLESQCEISGRRLLALRLVGRSVRCTYYWQDNALCLPLSRIVAFLRASVARTRREKKEKERKRKQAEKKGDHEGLGKEKKLRRGRKGALRSLPSRGQLPSPVFTCL